MGLEYMIEKGEVKFLKDTCWAFMAGIRTGTFGIPFMPVKGLSTQTLLSYTKRLEHGKQ